ncbi:uncharacterized protein LOC125422913 [Ziziphus jujuba]|uniref:Uncharacterized protein LOC125422913 n=1 Tax=Ziziphus jujuba TaxID=326968 RepID=A0ABM4A987_ZIZJJ|nr:uncharacterized protein LOC125422913 [Ziziphus jujuba]
MLRERPRRGTLPPAQEVYTTDESRACFIADMHLHRGILKHCISFRNLRVVNVFLSIYQLLYGKLNFSSPVHSSFLLPLKLRFTQKKKKKTEEKKRKRTLGCASSSLGSSGVNSPTSYIWPHFYLLTRLASSGVNFAASYIWLHFCLIRSLISSGVNSGTSSIWPHFCLLTSLTSSGVNSAASYIWPHFCLLRSLALTLLHLTFGLTFVC